MRTKLKGHDVSLGAPVRYAHLAPQWPWRVCREGGCLEIKIHRPVGRKGETEGTGLADKSW